MSEFVAITDAPFTIQTGSDIDKDFDFDLRTPDVSKSSVLMFRLNTFETETGLVLLTVKINGQGVMTQHPDQLFGGDAHRTLHEVVAPGILSPGDNNIEFSVSTDSPGLARISDVVLLWQQARSSLFPRFLFGH
jgi:hypothetical protein